jgi:thiol-disulfide isomerase/thioredoxin
MPGIFEITNFQEHQSFINNNNKAIIFFGSIACSHCRNMVPVINQMANKYETVAFGHVETTQVEVENVDGVPVFVGYKIQAPIDVILGANPDKLERMIQTKLLI